MPVPARPLRPGPRRQASGRQPPYPAARPGFDPEPELLEHPRTRAAGTPLAGGCHPAVLQENKRRVETGDWRLRPVGKHVPKPADWVTQHAEPPTVRVDAGQWHRHAAAPGDAELHHLADPDALPPR